MPDLDLSAGIVTPFKLSSRGRKPRGDTFGDLLPERVGTGTERVKRPQDLVGSGTQPRSAPATPPQELDLSAGLVNRRPSLRAQSTISHADLEKPVYETQRGQPATSSASSDELRVMKGEQPVDRQGYSRQQDAQTRLSQMRDESYQEKQVREAKDVQWRADNQPEIDRQTKLYRQDIQKAKASGDPNKWVAEFGTKVAGRLLELAPGDAAKIHSEAALQAAEAEGADRSQLSQGAQNIAAGFVGSAPELGAMALGTPPIATFAAGSAIRSKSSDPMEIARAAGQGGLTGAAFDLPGIGEGVTKVLTGSAATGLGTAGIDLASGASPKEAAISGVTNAIMRGAPEAVRLRARGRVDETATIPTTETITTQNGTRDAQGDQRTQGDTEQRAIGLSSDAGALPNPDVAVEPHHSSTQPRRTRNTEHGARGQFKAGKVAVASVEPSVREGEKPRQIEGVPLKPEVDRWFGKSAVVDEKGAPLVVYRGESGGAELEPFERARTNERGFFFTPDQDIARIYSRGKDPNKFILQADKVLDLTKDDIKIQKWINRWGKESFDDWTERQTGETVSPADAVQSGALFDWEGDWSGERWKDLQATAEHEGYDAVILPDWDNGKGMFPSVVIFRPEQIHNLKPESFQPSPKVEAETKPPQSFTLTPRRQGVRSFPESVKDAGYQAESSNYDVLPNAETVSKADATIKAKGIDQAVSDLNSKSTEFTPEDVAVGIRAIQQHTASGDIQKSVDVAETLAQRLTAAGQTVQAASLVARLSPEGTLLRAQRLLPKGEKLTSEQGAKLVAASKEVVKHETKLATLSDRIAQMQSEASATGKGKIGTLQDRLTKLENEARARLAARTGVGKGSQTGASTIPLDIADYAIIGAAKLARKGVTLASWTNEMVGDFGEEIRPRLKAIYRESYRNYDEQRKQFASERETRGAQKAQPDSKDIQAVINERALARKDARTARSQLRSLYNDLSLTRAGKVKAVAGDILNVPRTLKSSVDLSAPRQGAMWMVNHPVQGAKLFFGKQIRAMRQVNYDRFVDQMESDPDYPLMTRSKLALTTTDARPNSLSGREEAFMSRLAGKIPGVSHSERAYTTFLDTARASWFKQLARQAEARARVDGKLLTNEHYTAIADFVNIATGRGNLGTGTLNKISPFLNAVFFAPKFAASKVQIFDPRVYSRLPVGARRTAMREAVTYFGAMTTAAVLLKYGLGAQVGMNPEESEFMKARAGNTRYDLANGTGQYVTLAARLLRNAENKRTGKKDAFGKSFMENVDRFARYKYSPPAGAVRNVWEGKNAIGEKTSVGRESVELVTPLFLKDLYDAYKEEGLTGVAKTSPGLVGVGVSTYGDRPQPQRKRGALKF